MNLPIEIEREDDGRWIAEVAALPGVMSYGSTRKESIARVEALGDLANLIEARVRAREELDLAAALAGDAALVFEMHLHMLAVRRGELPVLDGLDRHVGGRHG